MTSILCLAHYCDFHGPTPLMVTEGLPVPCGSCYQDDLLPSFAASCADKPRTSGPTPGGSTPANSASVAEALRHMDLGESPRSPSYPLSERKAPTQRAPAHRPARTTSQASATDTPSLRSHGLRATQTTETPSSKSRLDAAFSRTYDDAVTRRAGPCDNCALTLPRRQEDGQAVGISSRPDRGPTMRTRAPCARVFGVDDSFSPPASQTSSSTASDDEGAMQQRQPSFYRRTGTTVSTRSQSSTSSSAQSNAHIHYLDYTSTHESLVAESFSFVRASCLRTFSFETLPRSPTVGPLGSGAPVTSGFVTTHSAGLAVSGGPLFFGDPATGYTTAYIFRIPDVHARGHKRIYAFLALSSHRERLAMKPFNFIVAAFRDLAAWIQGLAEAEAERVAAGSGMASPSTSSPSTVGSTSEFDNAGSASAPFNGPVQRQAAHMSNPSGSSFLSGGGGLSRRIGPGFAGGPVTLKQRGLAELVGLPDFFIELHSRFVRLLLELGVVLST